MQENLKNVTLNAKVIEADETIFGTARDDSLLSVVEDDIIYGTDGDDTLYSNSYYDTIYGGDGDDFIDPSKGAEIVFGGAGDDTLIGNYAVYYGGEGADHYVIDLNWWGGTRIYDFEEGIDSYEVINQDSSGIRIVDYDGLGFNIIKVENNTRAASFVYADHDFDITRAPEDDTIYGGDGDDEFLSYSGDNIIYGGDGDDILWALTTEREVGSGSISVTFYGGDGDDTLWADLASIEENSHYVTFYGGEGADLIQIHGFGGDFIQGLITIEEFNPEEDVLDGLGSVGVWITSEGYDYMDYSSSTSPYTVISVHYSEDYLLSTMKSASDGNDLIYGVSTNDDLKGQEGADTIVGGAGDDRIEGDAGSDHVYGFEGNDTLYVDSATVSEVEAGALNAALGGAGDDKIYGGVNSDFLKGDDGNDTITGNDGDDTIIGSAGDDLINGGKGNDYLITGFSDGIESDGRFESYPNGWEDPYSEESYAGDDTLYGGAGNDSLEISRSGEGGTHILYGGAGDDYLYGYGAKESTLYGGAGDDTFRLADGGTVYGGAGDDVFRISGYYDGHEAIRIEDFNPDEDKLEGVDDLVRVETEAGFHLDQEDDGKTVTVLEVKYSTDDPDETAPNDTGGSSQDDDDDDDEFSDILTWALAFSFLSMAIWGWALGVY